ncbi:Ig-like domain-containing protein [Cellulomonas sp. NPDC089187]|uniref:Ig-like domain-containing protein n=1 Tax=Cellulomonas sp. NPDC089187 TaxID=3154970 RepID=UPI00342C6920
MDTGTATTTLRARTRLVLATIVSALLVVVGLPPAFAASGSATGLSLKVTSDGEAPWDASDEPGQDSSPTNGRVRTHDYVTYQWGYSVATAGDVTLTQTLPEGMAWVAAESTAACVEGTGAVSADGRTLSCTRANQTTGAATYQVRAEVLYGANGAALSSVLSSPGAADSAPAAVTVSATPRFNTEILPSVVGVESLNGVMGRSTNLYVFVYQPVDGARRNLGSEALADTFSLQVDVSDFGPNAQIGALCTMHSGNYYYTALNGTAGRTAENTVPDAGSWDCAQSAPGQPITLTSTGAITDGRTYPTTRPSGATLNAERAYVTSMVVRIWVPVEDYPTTRSVTLRTTDFDPVSVSGQSNYGEGCAPGYEPGAAYQSGVNGGGFSIRLEDRIVTAMRRTYAETGTLSELAPIPPGATTTQSGDAPMLVGQTLRFGGYVSPRTADESPDTNVSVCAVWDESLMTGGAITVPSVAPDGVEYAHLDLGSDDARRAVDCGQVGDGAAGWSGTQVGVVGGADAVNAVRYIWYEVPDKVSRYSAVSLTRTDAELPAGTPLPVFFQSRSDRTGLIKSVYLPETEAYSPLGTKAVVAGAEADVDLSWDQATATPGTTHTLSAQPTLTGPVDLTVEDTSVSVTLPSTVTMVANSWPAGMAPTSVVNPDGSTTYTFALGEQTVNATLPAITFDVTVKSVLTMPTTLTASAVITSSADPRAEQYRADSASIVVNAPAAFAVTKTADGAYAIPGVPVSYTVGWVNGLDYSVGTGNIVDVLPYDGDGRGTSGLMGLEVSDVQVTAEMAVQIQYTSDASADVMTAVEADRSGNTGVTWSDWPASGAVSGVTAVRFVTGEVEAGKAGEATIQVVPGVLSLNGSVVNDVSGVVTGLDQPVSGVAALDLESGAAQISGQVYQDQDYSWDRNTGDVDLSGITVTVTGYTFGANGIDDGGAGDDHPVTAADGLTAVTDASGHYVLDGLSPGSWTLAVPTPAGLTTAEQAEQPVVLAPTDQIEVNFGFIEPVDAPVAVDDTLRVSAGDTVTIPVMDNDTADASAGLYEVDTLNAEQGSVSWNAGEGELEYTAPADGNGQIEFTYTIRDKARQTATATVTVTVVPLPTATDVTRSNFFETVLDMAGSDVLSGATGDQLTLTAIGTPQNGTAVLNAAGDVVYTPNAGFVGTDVFTYTVTDSMGKTATANLHIVTWPELRLISDNDWTTTGTPVEVDVLANDIYSEDVVVSIENAPGNGTATVNPDGTITYTPEPGWTGTDTFTYRVKDEWGQSKWATVNVIVVEPIIAEPDHATTGEQMPVTIDVLANDTATQPTVEIGSNPSAGTVVVNADGTLTYTPNAGFTGLNSFTYRITDAAGQVAVGQVTVTVIGMPTADGASVSTWADTPVDTSLGWLASGDQITLSVTTQGAHGSVTVTDPVTGALTYTPNPGYVGPDEVELTWTDSVGQTVTVTLVVDVAQTPAANDDTAVTLTDQPVTADVLANDLGEGLTLTEIDPPMFGTAQMVNGQIVYTPNPGFSGTDTVTYRAVDRLEGVVEASLVILVYGAPVAPDLTATTGQEMGVILDPSSVVPDTGGALLAPWHPTLVGTSPDGTAQINPDNTITFVPNPGFSGQTSFTYTVTDDYGQQTTATITVTVLALTAEDLAATTDQDTPVTIDLMETVTGTAVSVLATGDPAHGTARLNADGTVTYTPDTGFAGNDSFTVTYTDEVGQLRTITVCVEVVAAPPAPGDEPTDPADQRTTSAPRSGVLAITGAQLTGVMALALAALLGGWWLLVIGRRRRADEEG